jgi:hypothetical protein
VVVLGYERMHADTLAEVTPTLEFLGLPLDTAVLEEAVEAALFERMRDLELQEGIPGHDYDRQDASALRTRRGRVGSFTEHLSEDEAERVREQLDRSLSEEAAAVLRAVVPR